MTSNRSVRVARALQNAVLWIKQTSGQLTDARAVAISTSALIAAERNPYSPLVQQLSRRLAASQRPSGGWGDELWDTVWAVKAMLDTGCARNHPVVRRALSFIKGTRDPITQTWYDEPFETMLVLDLLAEIDREESTDWIESGLEWVASLQSPSGVLIGTRYTGMAISLFSRAAPASQIARRVIDRGIAALRKALDGGQMWTSASWSNYYALNALLDVGADLDDPVVTAATDWFLDHQDASGAWNQVSAVHDTAMAVLVLSRLLQVPLVYLSPAQVAVMRVSRENGGLRVDFHGSAHGTLIPSEKMKLSDSVREDLAQRQQKVLHIIGRTRGPDGNLASAVQTGVKDAERELRRIGQYTFGHLIPSTIQGLLHNETADHIRLDVDERVIDLPWELVHDGEEFLCLRFAAGRRLISEQAAASFRTQARAAQDMSALVLANPTGDLPAAEREGEKIAHLLQNQCGVHVDFARRDELTKEDFLLSLRSYDIVHFAGHAKRHPANPDESCLLLADGEVPAFEIARFLQNPAVSVVFLNACWSAQEAQHWDSYSPVMRGLGRTFIYSGVGAFIGYLVPIPDNSATRFAVEMYSNLAAGRSIGESVRRGRVRVREKNPDDLTWASAVLYGDPAVRVFEPGKRP